MQIASITHVTFSVANIVRVQSVLGDTPAATIGKRREPPGQSARIERQWVQDTPGVAA